MIIYIKIIVGPLRCMMPSIQKSWITICHNKQTIIYNFPILPVCSEIWPPHLNLARYFLSQHKSFWSQSNLETYMILFLYLCVVSLYIMNKYHPRRVSSWNIPGNPGDVCGLSVGWNKQNDNKFNKLLTKHVHSARTHAHTPALTHEMAVCIMIKKTFYQFKNMEDII